MSSIDMWRYIVYNNLVTWSHMVTGGQQFIDIYVAIWSHGSWVTPGHIDIDVNQWSQSSHQRLVFQSQTNLQTNLSQIPNELVSPNELIPK